MRVTTGPLGVVEVDPESVVDLSDGLLGFESARRFSMIPADETGSYCWLQSLDTPDLFFLAVVPAFFFDSYEPEIPDEDAAALGLDTADDALVLCLVTVADDAITANLMGPVVVNTATRAARQVVLVDQGWSTREPLGQT